MNQSIKEYLNTVLKHSIFLKAALSRDPSLSEGLECMAGKKRSVREIAEDFVGKDYLSMDEAEFLSYIRKFKMREYLLIAIEDLCLKWSVGDITAHLSSFAMTVTEMSYNYAMNALKKELGVPLTETEPREEIPFCVIALGKFGGWELNFSSDIDIMFVYGTEKGGCTNPQNGKMLSAHEFFCKLGEKIKFLISHRTEEGIVFRVDLRLRPNGDKGDIALPLKSYEIYYESFGQSWERMMLLKGLPVAGDIGLGNEFLKTVKPFVFRRSIDTKLIDDLINVKSKINSRIKLKKQDKNVKLGFGGLREIEFVVQAIQIMHYPKDNEVFNRNTLSALEILEQKGILDPNTVDVLTTAYNFYRKLEHMAQIENELQTHVVPEYSENFNLYLERCGFTSSVEFFKKYKSTTTAVNEIFSSILSTDTQNNDFFLFDEEFTSEDRISFIKDMGVSNPEECVNVLERMIFGKNVRKFSANQQETLKNIVSKIVNELPKLNYPLVSLLNFEKLFKSGSNVSLIKNLSTESDVFLNKLLNIFYMSQYLADTIIRNNNVLDYIYDPKPYVYDSVEIYGTLKKLAEQAQDEEYEYELLRKYHQELLFNLGSGYLNKGINVIELNSSLTNLARGTVKIAFEREFNSLKERYGEPSVKYKNCDYVVLGMGKLGSFEMSFGSDLDLIVLYEDVGYTGGKNAITNQEFYSKLIQRVISYLSTQTVFGYLYKIDMRLRPSGSSGTLVTTIASFEEYQKNRAMLWEKQALLRSDVINTESLLKDEFFRIKDDVLFSKVISKSEIEDICQMRLRIEKEKGSPVTSNNIKAGYGGLIDIEFAVQMLQLFHGKFHKELRGTNTHDILHEIKENEILKNRDFYALHGNYLFFRNIENLIRLYKNTSSSKLPSDNETLEKLSMFFGYKNNGAENLINEYIASRKVVRGAFNRIFGVNL